MTNLDRIAVEASQSMIRYISEPTKQRMFQAKDLERLTTDSLGVLQEQGLYAFYLYMMSRSGYTDNENGLKPDEMVTCIIVLQLLLVLNRPELNKLSALLTSGWDDKPAQINKQKENILRFISREICGDLRRLLMVKSLFEQALIYTRYSAKAIGTPAAEGS